MAVYPVNDTSMVNRIGQILDVDLDTAISLNNLDGQSYIMDYYMSHGKLLAVLHPCLHGSDTYLLVPISGTRN